MSDFLAAEGIPALTGYRREHITTDIDTVIVGNAISRATGSTSEVLDRKLRYCSLPEAIREHFLWDARSIVIAGTHGETTTTSLAGWLLTDGGLDPSVLIGGIAQELRRSWHPATGSGRAAISSSKATSTTARSSTRRPSSSSIFPDIAVVNNVEFDHADIYADMSAVTLAFRRLVNLVPRKGLLLLGADSEAALALKAAAVSRVQTFGTAPGSEWQAFDLEPAGQSTRFQVRRSGSPFGTFDVPLVGTHNVRNALAAIAVAAEAGLTSDQIAWSLRRFTGRQAAARSRRQLAGVTTYPTISPTIHGRRRNARGPARVEPRRPYLGSVSNQSAVGWRQRLQRAT